MARFLIPLLCIALSGPALGVEDQNIREQCRLAVSSFYINLKNNILIGNAASKRWSQQLQKSQKAKKTLLSQLAKVEEQAKGSFDRQLEDRILGIENQIKVLEAQERQGQSIVAKEK